MRTAIDTRSDRAAGAALTAAAFGDEPGRWPLPSAITPRQLWLRAVAAGGQGRYGSADDDLATLIRAAPAASLASLAHSTRASFLRQLGWHARARGWDGRALALAGADPEAAADALIGLAADALGVGRLAASAVLLRRADQEVAQARAPRLAIRRAWVAAELAMAAGDGAAAVRHAGHAVAAGRAERAVSARHRAKSEMVWAAALCSAGDVDRARAVGEEALESTERLGLRPLRWALACLLIDLTSSTRTTRDLCRIRDECAEHVRRAGGTWSACAGLLDARPGYPRPGYPRPGYPRPGYPRPGYPRPGYR